MSIDDGAPIDELEQQVAETVGRVLRERDTLVQALGIELVAIWPGRARLAMTVRDDMLDGLGAGHGGGVFTLAETACGFAAKSYNQQIVTSTATIHYAAPARPGDRLTAEARERSRGRRVGVYDVSVSNQEGKLVALYRGEVQRRDGDVVPGLTAAA
jgi:acyl-CoA thioesterase